MRLLFTILLVMLQQPAAAEVFKCLGKQGSVSYQSTPCGAQIKQQQLEINADPAAEATAKTKLDEVRGEYDSRKAAQLATENLAAEQNYKAEKLEVDRRKVLALQELAAAKRHQTKLIRHERRHQRKQPRHSSKSATRSVWRK